MQQGAEAARLPAQDQPIGGNELAQGLLLVRASAINVARLHLAVEDCDRRRVLETMDDLVALDRKIGSFVSDIPTSDSGIDAMQNEVEQLSRALARDKLALVAGVSRRGQREHGEPAIGRGEGEPEPATLDVDMADAVAARRSAEDGGVLLKLAKACLLLVLLVLAGAIILLATGEWQDLIGQAERLLRL